MSHEMTMLIAKFLVIPIILFFGYLYQRYSGMNVKRGKRRGGEVLHYEDMTPEQKKEYGFIPNGNLPPHWQTYSNTHGRLLPNGRLRDPKK